MGNLKISSNLFIGSKELQKLKEFADDDGFRLEILNNSMAYGLINNTNDGNWTNGRVEQGTNAGTIKHGAIFGIDDAGDFLVKAAEDNIAITNDSAFYWVKVAHVARNYEVYDVDVDASGNLTAPDTDGNFSDILRGQPNIASRVEFFGASLNTAEYDVQSVADDNNAILQGSFQAETGLKLIVVGTFSPDANPSAGDKNIFNYDHVTVSLELETVLNTPPSFTADQEFHLARVSRTGSTLTIEDKRRNYVYMDKADFQHQDMLREANVLIGVEAVKYTDDFSTRQENIVELAWAFRSSNWTPNPSVNTVTINGGLGGIWKTTAPFNDGDLDGWRLYTENGKYSIISASSEAGGQINLILDSLDTDDYANASQQLLVTPHTDEITIHAIADLSANNLVEKKATFPINTPVGRMSLLVYADPSVDYLFKYSYGQGKEYDIWRDLPSDVAEGYLTEASFDANGIISGSTRQTYTSSATVGYITLMLNPNAFKKIVERVDLGDVPGIDYQVLDNIFPIKTLIVGTQKQTQVYQGSLTIDTNHFISLETAGAIEGNQFILKFENSTNVSSYSFQIVEDYISPGNPGTLILDFSSPTTFWLDRAADNNMWLYCEFDGTNWSVMPIASVTQDILDDTGLEVDSILRDGSQAFTGDQAMGGFKLTGLAAGTANGHSIRYEEFTLLDGAVIKKDGSATYSNDQPMGGLNKLTGLAAGTANGHSIRYEQHILKADKAQEAWTNITLINGWVAKSGQTPQWRTNEFGFVTVRGVLESGSSTSSVITGDTMPGPPEGLASGAAWILANPAIGAQNATGVIRMTISEVGRMSVAVDDYSTSTDIHLIGIHYYTDDY